MNSIYFVCSQVDGGHSGAAVYLPREWGEMRPMVREKWKHKINFLMTSDPMRGCGLPSLLTDHTGNPGRHFMEPVRSVCDIVQKKHA